MRFFFRIAVLTGLVFSMSSAVVASDRPTSFEGRLLLWESQHNALALDLKNLRCLQAGGSEAECRQEAYKLDAEVQRVTAQANAIQTKINGDEVLSLAAAKDHILRCAAAIKGFGEADHSDQQLSQDAEASFTGQCSDKDLQDTLATAQKDIKDAVKECLGAGADIADTFMKWEAQAQAGSLVDVLKVAARDADGLTGAKDGAEECINSARMAAESLQSSANALMSAVAATAAFCTAVPEPYSCAIFGAIQLLMALFSSGDGAGGDGNGPSDGEGPGVGGGPAPEPPVAAVAPGSGCNNVRRDGTTLLCDGFEFKYAFGGAKIDVNGGNAGADLAEALASRLDAADGSFADLFGDGKMVARGRDQIQFCVHRLPSLPNQFFPDQWAPNGFDQNDDKARVLVVFELTDVVRREHAMTLLPVGEGDLNSPGCAQP